MVDFTQGVSLWFLVYFSYNIYMIYYVSFTTDNTFYIFVHIAGSMPMSTRLGRAMLSGHMAHVDHTHMPRSIYSMIYSMTSRSLNIGY